MKTKIISFEIGVPGDRIRSKLYLGKVCEPPSNGEISIYVINHGVFIIVPLDDLSDDSRQVVLNTEH